MDEGTEQGSQGTTDNSSTMHVDNPDPSTRPVKLEGTLPPFEAHGQVPPLHTDIFGRIDSPHQEAPKQEHLFTKQSSYSPTTALHARLREYEEQIRRMQRQIDKSIHRSDDERSSDPAAGGSSRPTFGRGDSRAVASLVPSLAPWHIPNVTTADPTTILPPEVGPSRRGSPTYHSLTGGVSPPNRPPYCDPTSWSFGVG
jgi:hypothetical protein